MGNNSYRSVVSVTLPAHPRLKLHSDWEGGPRERGELRLSLIVATTGVMAVFGVHVFRRRGPFVFDVLSSKPKYFVFRYVFVSMCRGNLTNLTLNHYRGLCSTSVVLTRNSYKTSTSDGDLFSSYKFLVF